MPPYSAQPHHDSSGGATPPEVQFVGGVHSHGSVACAAAALARIKSCTSRSSIFGAPRLSDHRSQKNSRMKRIWQSFRATEFVGVMHESYAWESMHESVWFCRLCAVGDGRAAQHTQGRDSVWDRFIHSLPSIASRTHTHTFAVSHHGLLVPRVRCGDGHGGADGGVGDLLRGATTAANLSHKEGHPPRQAGAQGCAGRCGRRILPALLHDPCGAGTASNVRAA